MPTGMTGALSAQWRKSMDRRVEDVEETIQAVADEAQAIEGEPLVPSGARASAKDLREKLREAKRLAAQVREHLQPSGNGSRPEITESVDQDAAQAVVEAKGEG